MTRIKTIDIDPVDVDSDGIATAQTLGAAGDFSLDGALASGGTVTFDYPRQISQTAAANESARTFTITGTNEDGAAQTLAMAGANIATTETAEYWATISSIASDDATAGDVSFGTVDEIQTKTYPINHYNQIGATIAVDVTGTIDYTVQETFDPMSDSSNPAANATWYDITALADKTADLVSQATVGATAVRFTINSYTDTAELQARIVQTFN